MHNCVAVLNSDLFSVTDKVFHVLSKPIDILLTRIVFFLRHCIFYCKILYSKMIFRKEYVVLWKTECSVVLGTCMFNLWDPYHVINVILLPSIFFVVVLSTMLSDPSVLLCMVSNYCIPLLHIWSIYSPMGEHPHKLSLNFCYYKCYCKIYNVGKNPYRARQHFPFLCVWWSAVFIAWSQARNPGQTTLSLTYIPRTRIARSYVRKPLLFLKK